jgi:hypothetical protein
LACVGLLAAHLFNLNLIFLSDDICVPDHGSRDRDVVLVRRRVGSRKPRGVRNLEWGGNGDEMGMGWEGGGQLESNLGPRWTGSHHAKGGLPSK